MNSPDLTARAPIDVVVGILLRPNGDVLLGQRPPGKPYAGYWEFPGGKVEPGEDLLTALRREFVEELGLVIDSAEPWCGVEHVYEHAHVRLHFFISRAWRGEAQSLEGQAFAWQGRVDLTPLLPATIPLLEWLDKVRFADYPSTDAAVTDGGIPAAPETALQHLRKELT